MRHKFFILFYLLIAGFSLSAQVNADVLGRRISLNIRETSIEEILKTIETDDFAFTYSAEVFDVKKRVSINVKDETIEEVLQVLFRGQGMECQQLGNKLLIRKKRIPRPVVPKSDTSTLKTTSKPVGTVAAAKSATNRVSRMAETAEDSLIVTTPKTEIIEREASPGTAQNPSVGNATSGLYQAEKMSNALWIAAYEASEKAPLIFVPIYTVHPRRLLPVETMAPILAEEKPKRVKEPKTDGPAKDNKFRIYLGPNVAYTELANRDAVLIGGQLVYNPSKNFGIGVAGKGFISRNEPDAQLNGVDYTFAGGYGGLLVEATLFPDQPFHISFPVTFGLGEIMYNHLDPLTGLNTVEDRRTIFVFEPSAYLELNVIKYLRLGFGASYRDASSADLKYQDSQQVLLEKDGLDGLSFNVMIKFGLF